MIYGIIDIGSNTIRMAVYKIEDRNLELLIKKKYTTGLAAYIQDNCMQQEGIDKTCAVLQKFTAFLQTFQITNVVAFTMAALRNADNSKAAVQQIIDRTGVKLTVLSGDEEARFGFIGATHVLDSREGILVDIGGASTELVLYRDNQILQVVSLPIGSLSMYAKYVTGLLPSHAEAAEIRRETLCHIVQAKEFQPDDQLKICGIGGTFKGTKLLNNELFHLDPDHIEIPADHLSQMIQRFACDSDMVANDLLDILVKVVPERIKTVLPGMIIADRLAEYFGTKTIIYSDSGVREGYLYDQVIGK